MLVNVCTEHAMLWTYFHLNVLFLSLLLLLIEFFRFRWSRLDGVVHLN